MHQEGVYTENFAAAAAGVELATYHVRVVNYDGTESLIIIPIGRTTIAISDRVQYIDVVSMVHTGDAKYKKGELLGTIAYENAHVTVQ